MSSITASREGKWMECRLDSCKMMFKTHPEGHKRHALNDTLGICPLCYFKRKMENGTIPKPNSGHFEFHHKSPDSKPEADSL